MYGKIKHWASAVAKAIPFNNSLNSYFRANNAEDAIVELDFRQITNEPTGFCCVTDSLMSFNNALLTFTIQPSNGSFEYYSGGKSFTVSVPNSVTITDTEGLWFFHYDFDTLYATQTPWTYNYIHGNNTKAFVAVIYWDATNKKAIFFLEERHGLVMDWATHSRLHRINGAQILPNTLLAINFIEKGDGSLDSHAQLGITNGVLVDEDINNTITHSNTPTNPFEQFLDTYAKIPLYYRDGAGVLRKIDATNFPVVWDGINTIKYNYYDELTGTWSLVSINEGYFTTTFIFATNNIYEPIIGIVGTKQSVSSLQAADQDLSDITEGLPFQEFYPLYRLVFQSKTSFTNTPKATLSELLPGDQIKTDNDRYAVPAWYIGNAGNGKYLDSFPGSSSYESPFVFPENSFIRTVTLHASSTSTGTIGFFRIIGGIQEATPYFTISLSNSTYIKLDLSAYFLEADEICYQIVSGSITKPTIRFWVQTDL